MHPSFEQLVDEFNAGRLAYPDFAKLAKETTPVPALVLSQLQEAYAAARATGFPKQRPGLRGADIARERPDISRLSNALMVALAAPDRSFTTSLCEIAAESEWLFGCQEMALDVLWDLTDPASLGPLTKMCARPDLRADSTDWRKALDTIFALFHLGLVQPDHVEAAFQAIRDSGNDFADTAQEHLSELRRRVGRADPPGP